MRDLKADICIIGGGSGGLTVAAFAAQMGATTVLIERGAMGGDCLNTGCIPSKALLACAHAADAARRASRFGVGVGTITVDAAGVRAHVEGAIARIAPHDSVERFEGLGVEVIQASARFTGRTTVEAGETRIVARRVVIATGSSPLIPPIEGLDRVACLTNETIFALAVIPRHLIIIGGGPIGIEMAQAHRSLGAEVTVLEALTIMPRDDAEMVAVLRSRLEADGIKIFDRAKVKRVEATGKDVAVTYETGDGEKIIEGSHLLVATGRQPNTAGLDLDNAGVAYSGAGIEVDRRLRTSNRKIYAIGDVIAGGQRFTHVAGYQAGVVLKNTLFRWPARVRTDHVPWVTYSAPELAQVGLSEADAREGGIAHRIVRVPFEANDRARAEGDCEGFIKVVISPKRGRILGAGIVGPHAGELIGVWCLAISRRLRICAMIGMMAPYPTLGDISRQVANEYYRDSLYCGKSRWVVRLLSRFG